MHPKNVVPRLEGKDLTMLRLMCFIKNNGRCANPKCNKKLHFEKRFDNDQDAYEMAHKRNKRMWGDHIDNVEPLCKKCHSDSHNAGGKPVKAK